MLEGEPPAEQDRDLAGNTNPTNAEDSNNGTANTMTSAAQPGRPRMCRAMLSITAVSPRWTDGRDIQP